MTGQRVEWLRDDWSFLVSQTYPAGMPVIDRTNWRWVLHDGVTAGGIPGPLRKSKAGAPTTTDLTTSGEWGIFKNTTSGAVVLAYNDGGTVKTVTLT